MHADRDRRPRRGPAPGAAHRGGGGREPTPASSGARSSASPADAPPVPIPWTDEGRQLLRRAAAAPGAPAIAGDRGARPAWASGCGCCPSGSPCAASPSATPTTASPSIGTSCEAAAERRRAGRPRRPSGPAGGRHAAARHRQGLPRRPHRGRHRAARPTSARAWATPPTTSAVAAGHGRATTCCSPTSRPAATSTTTARIARGRRRGRRRCGRCACSPRSPRPTRSPPARRRGTAGRRGWSTSWSTAPAHVLGGGVAGRRHRRRRSPPTSSSRCMAERPTGRSTATATAHRRRARPPGLFSRVAGVLALNGLDVLDARGASPTTTAWRSRCSSVESSIGTGHRVGPRAPRPRARARRAARPRGPAGRAGPGVPPAARSRAALGPTRPRSRFDNDDVATRRRSIEVHAPDVIGRAVPDHPGHRRARARHPLGQGADARRTRSSTRSTCATATARRSPTTAHARARSSGPCSTPSTPDVASTGERSPTRR